MTTRTRQIIFWGVLAAIVIAAMLCVKFMPLWASLSTLIAFFGGALVGWAAHVLYQKYVKPVK